MPQGLRDLVDLTNPMGLHSWLSVGVVALLGWSCLKLGRATGRRFCYWAGGFFLAMSADDALEGHEALGRLVHPVSEGVHIYAWVLMLGPLLIVAGGVLLLGFWGLFRDFSQRVLLFAGLACLGLALGLEACEGELAASAVQLRGFTLDEYTQVPEEFLELLGPLLLLFLVVQTLQQVRSEERKNVIAGELATSSSFPLVSARSRSVDRAQ